MGKNNNVQLVGYVADEPRKFGNDKPVVKIKVACKRQFASIGEMKDTTDYIQVTCFGHWADYALLNLVKGDKVAVQGLLRNNNWVSRDGKKNYEMIVETESLVKEGQAEKALPRKDWDRIREQGKAKQKQVESDFPSADENPAEEDAPF
jgi:single stranded DNA-binding protein